MNLNILLSILRNPHGFSTDEIREARLEAANLLDAREKQIEYAANYEFLRGSPFLSRVSPMITIPEYSNGVFLGTHRAVTGDDADKIVKEARLR